MIQSPHRLRPFLVAAALATTLLPAWTAPRLAVAQASRFLVEIVAIDIAERRVTLKASMGRQTMRVAAGVEIDALRPGDKAWLTFGQEGSESIITGIERVEP
jgi:hypothetical protein